MIIPEHKIFFHHIPKTGGKTIDNFLCNYFNLPYKSWLYFTEGLNVRKSFTDKEVYSIFNICHLPYIELFKLAKKSNIQIDNSWDIFTIVRNPYYRACSAIFFQPILECMYHMHTLPTIKEKRKLFTKSYNQYLNTDGMSNDWFSHRIPQHVILETDVNIPSYNIYKYEEGLENILTKALNNKIKGNIDLTNRHQNKNDLNIPKTDYLSLFTRDYIEKINEYYYKDFQFCGYEMWNPLDFPES
jgi:hypothetical protein